jgi:transcriptional regulator with XRE-family HTH domain
MDDYLPLLSGIGVSIAAHRRAAGNMTQAELASVIGRSVQWVSGVEQGKRHADRLTDLLRIAQALNCRVEDLLGRPLDTLSAGPRPHAETVAAVRAVLLRAAVPSSGVLPAPGSLRHGRPGTALPPRIPRWVRYCLGFYPTR